MKMKSCRLFERNSFLAPWVQMEKNGLNLEGKLYVHPRGVYVHFFLEILN